MAPLIRSRQTPISTAVLSLLLFVLSGPAHSTRRTPLGNFSVDLEEVKSADGSLQVGVGGRDLSDPVVEHVSPGGRARRVAVALAGLGDIRQSAYVCEDGTLRLSCTAGKHIDVLRANFGRFSITLCNPSGFLDWSVNCASGNSLAVLTQRCSGQSECSVEASGSIFGDPCPTTSKYLEVHYKCSSEQDIDLNRSSSTATVAAAAVDNDNAQWSNSGARGEDEQRPTSLEDSLSGQVLTVAQSSMGRPALAEDKLAPKDGLNQDLLPTSNYLNSKCNQPDSESSPFASAKCKQMDLLRFNGRKENSKKEQTLLPATNQTHLVEGRQQQPLWPPQRPPATTPPTLTTRVHSAAARDDKVYDQTRPHFDPPEKGASSAEVHSPSTHSSFEAGLSPTCSPLTYRGIDWPPTVAGTVAFRSCPQDASGTAQWPCNSDSPAEGGLDGPQELQPGTRWSNLPDLSRCHSRWLLDLHSFQNVNNFRNDIWKSILATLQQSMLYGADLVELNSLLHASLQNIFDTNQANGNVATTTLQPLSSLDALFETVSFLVGQDTAAWFDLPAFKREVTALDLLDIGAKYGELICLDARHSSNDKVIKQAPHLVVSCYSASKLVHSFQLSSQTRGNTSREFKLTLHPSPQYLPSTTTGKVTVSVVMKADNLTNPLNENVYFGVIILDNLEQYFEVNANYSAELNLKANLKPHVQLNLRKPRHFLNSNVVRVLVFDNSRVSVTTERAPYLALSDLNWLEIEYKHSVASSSLWHQCVHWDTNRNEWSSEECALLRSNETHTLCSCRFLVSTCSLLAGEKHSTNQSDAAYKEGGHLEQRPKSSILTCALIGYMWLVLLLARCRHCFFNEFNFCPILVACVARTTIELCFLSWTLWPEWSANRCQSMLFLLLVLVQTISSSLAIFLFQNGLLTMLAGKIYLSKNYATSLHALNSSCWPIFGKPTSDLLNGAMVLSPMLQLSAVVIGGLSFLHCSQKVFSDYGYPNLHCIQLQTTLFEKHIKDVSRSRLKHILLWSLGTCLFIFAVLGSHCAGLAVADLSISLIGLDVGLSLAFLLFWRLKYLSAVAKGCHSTPTHCSSKDLSSSTSIRDNSISILSESSKTFLTLPGQISLSKMLDSPKIYPSPHRSSSTYGRNCHPSSHLYESPRHLYKYERYLYQQQQQHQPQPNSCATSNAYTSSSMAHRANVYPLTVNHCSPMEATSPIEPGAFFAATDADGTLMPIDRSFEGHFARSISLATRSAGPAHAFRPRFLDRDNFLALS